jgi:mRNA-degrading endonuclease toxin of MazEF toxin-antitoxin module
MTNEMKKGAVWMAIFPFDLTGPPYRVLRQDAPNQYEVLECTLEQFHNMRRADREKDYFISLKAKERPVLLLRDSDKPEFKHTLVAPIGSIDVSDERKAAIYRKNKNPHKYFLNEKRQGVEKESFANLRDIRNIPKNYFLHKLGMLSEAEMDDIDKRLYLLMDMGLQLCDSCAADLNNYLNTLNG